MSVVSVSKCSHRAAFCPGLALQVSFVKEAITKVLNLALLFADGWQAGLGAWR